MWMNRLILPLLLLTGGAAGNALTLDNVWNRTAHFQQVGILNWEKAPGGSPSEGSSWFLVQDRKWYAFSRREATHRRSHCPADQWEIVARESTDNGKSWTTPIIIASPGQSNHGDGCAVVDGDTYFDSATQTYHLLAQCLDRDKAGGWSLCHYTRKGSTPLGAFVADSANPVVLGGQLWSQLCNAEASTCTKNTVDEGTPDIVMEHGGLFFVTIHGFDPVATRSVRGVVATSNFRDWSIVGHGLPGSPILSAADCSFWLTGCIGVGTADALLTSGKIYLVVETMDKGLACVRGQQWVFHLLRAKRGTWPQAGKHEWENMPGHAFIKGAWDRRDIQCQVNYARWISDGPDTYLVYEDWGPHNAFKIRRLLKLVPGKGGGPVVIDR